MNEDHDDLTIDGQDLLLQLTAGSDDEHQQELTITDPRPLGGRWAPAVPIPAATPKSSRPAGLTRLQLGVAVGTFALGAVLGLFVGLSRGDESNDSSEVPQSQSASAEVTE